MKRETRFRMVEKQDPERFKALAEEAQRRAEDHYSIYRQLATVIPDSASDEGQSEEPTG